MNGPYEAVSLDPYAVLGVATDAEFEVLKTAYRRLVRENHPDIAQDKGGATLRMVQINAAWQLVGEPGKRAAFDARLRFEAREREQARKAAAAPKPTPTSHTSTSRPTPRPAATPTSRANEKRQGPPAAQRAQEPRNSAPKSKNAKNEASKIPSATANRAQRPTSGNSKTRGSQRLAQASRLIYLEAKPAEAIELCRSVIRSDFRNVPARELMGEALLRLGQSERAAAIWEQALILQPGNVALHKRWKTLRDRITRTQGTSTSDSSGQPKAQPSASTSTGSSSGSNIPPKTGSATGANSAAHSSGQPSSQAKNSEPIPTIHAVVRPKVAEKREQPSLLRRLSARLLRR